MEDLAEAHYCGMMFNDMQDHWVKIGGQGIPVYVADATEPAADGEHSEVGPAVVCGIK